METTKTKTLYEVNIYCELYYEDYPEWEQRLEQDLPDANLIFITDKEDWSIEDAKEKHEEIKDFLEREKENIVDLHEEWIYPREEGMHPDLDEDDCFIFDNWCGQE
tara:strand:+ start:8125 stop:8442 length:318 start_codon:yes stop_codon:yes gene_type:complete